jgi:hypothetical protein
MAAPTNAANVKKALANSEPSTHGTRTRRRRAPKPVLVVIDVLAKVRKPTGNKQLYEADYEALAGLAQLAGELGLAIVVVHHTRKMASDDLMETVSGSTAA